MPHTHPTSTKFHLHRSSAKELRLIQILLFGLLLFVTAFLGKADAQFSPTEVAVIANSNSTSSQEIAKHYAKARGIPESQILEVAVAEQEQISRIDFEQKVVVPLRVTLEERGLSNSIRVLVSTHGLPLRIQTATESEDQKLQRTALDSSHKQARELLRKLIKDAESFAVDKPDPAFTSDIAKLDDSELIKRTNESIHRAGKRLETSEAGLRTPELNVKFSNMVSQFGGLAALTKVLRPASQTDADRSNERIRQLKDHLQSAQKVLLVLEEVPSAENQQRAINLTRKIYGAAGAMQRAQALSKKFDMSSSDASFESELSLLWWDADMYPLTERVANPWFHRLLNNNAPDTPIPVLFVSRLDAPKPDIIKQTIDTTLQVESSGLVGKAYFDARGLKDGNQSYIDYDENIRQTAELFRKHTDYDVTLDNEGRTFSNPGEAKDTAVYAGWYKLRNYEDAFTFAPGAIAFHVASEEAISIRGKDEKGWCANALARGVSVTMGAVGEPYLDSFPKALEFYGLLLSGKYSVIEAYYLTLPHLSWRMTLFGDPLYNPWKGKNLVTGAQIAERSPESRNLSVLPEPPSKQAFPDPIAARNALLARRSSLATEIEGFFRRVDEQAKLLQESIKK